MKSNQAVNARSLKAWEAPTLSFPGEFRTFYSLGRIAGASTFADRFGALAASRHSGQML